MEEDIKMLEWSQQQMRLGNLPDYNQKVYKAIENLINGYKELEEENEKLLEVKISASANNRIMELEKENKTLKNVVSEIFNSEDVTDKYIPVSLVEEKIEEVNKSNGYSPVNKILIEQVLNSILKIGG